MNYTICGLSDEQDEEDLLKFWNEHHERDLDEKYKWIYEGNPAGKAVVSLIKDDETSTCVGCSAVFPREFSVNGVNLRAAVGGDLFIDKQHRVLVPALMLVKRLVSMVQEKKFDLIYLFPNKNAEPVMKRAGFKYLGPFTRTAKPIRTSELLHELHFNKYLNRVLSPLLDVALELFTFETWYRFGGGFACEEISCFDERFDELWLKSKSRFQAAGQRTSKFLTWRYLKNPNAEYRIFAIFDSNRTELKGYIIYCMDENSVEVRDFILPADKKAIRVFITHFLRHARKASPKAIAFLFLENKEILDLLKRFGFVERKSGCPAYYCCNEDVLKRFPIVEDAENWLLLNGDQDG